jgi:hypothetical protein
MTAEPWTPRTLASRTFTVFRERPSLAVPVLVADLLSFSATHIQHALHRPVLELIFASRQSVLSSHKELVLTPRQNDEAFWILIPLIWAAYFVSGYVYSAAFLAVSTMVGRPEPLDSRFVIHAVLARKAPLLRFALRFFGLILLGWLLSFPLLFLVSQPWARDRHFGALNAGSFAGFLIEIAIALFALGPALRLLNAAAGFSRLALFAALTTFVAQIALFLLMASANPLLVTLFPQPTLPAILFRDATLSLLGAVPYVFLFIALSLLATPTETGSVPEEGPDPSADNAVRQLAL